MSDDERFYLAVISLCMFVAALLSGKEERDVLELLETAKQRLSQLREKQAA